ncbi:MAG: histidinol-phosphate transaminase [Rhodanobacteraceae bacterium]
MNVLDLARPEIRALQPYSSARMESGSAAIMLNANESPWPPPGHDSGLNRYPDPQPESLRTRLADLYGVDVDNLLIGRGSDEAIDLLVRAFCRPGVDAIAISPPTFGMYAVCANIQGAAVVNAPLDEDFKLDPETVLEAVSSDVKVMFVCSPNNPTGGLVPLDVIEQLTATLRGRAMVVVDEAYIEFASAASATGLVARYPNLGVLRTLSKAWALAGARIGCLVADPQVIALLRRIMPPYPLPTPCVAAAEAALDESGQRVTARRVADTVAERNRMANLLQQMPGVKAVLPSRANFLTVRLAHAAGVCRHLAAQGIVVRDLGRQARLADCLRFSIGTAQENSRLIQALSQLTEVA